MDPAALNPGEVFGGERERGGGTRLCKDVSMTVLLSYGLKTPYRRNPFVGEVDLPLFTAVSHSSSNFAF